MLFFWLQDRAIKIDTHQASLTENSPDISFKTDPTAIPELSSTPSDWLLFSTDYLKSAHSFMKASQNLRDQMCVAIQV